MKHSFARTLGGLLVPRQYVYSNKTGIPCGFCRVHIFKEHEANGEIHYKDGKPICARDRILQGRMGATIIADKGKRDADIETRTKLAQKKADEKAIRVADITQTATGTKRKRK